MNLEGENYPVHGKDRAAADLVQQINAKNAKLLAFFMVLGFISYHGILHLQYGIDSCKWLLSDGSYKGETEWQPYGCMMHKYTLTDTRRCFRYLAFLGRHNHFVFVGDSRIRQLYEAFLKQLDSSSKSSSLLYSQTKPESHAHTDLSFGDAQLRLKVQFIWSPLVNKHMAESFNDWKVSSQPPSVIVAGGATWSIKESNGSQSALLEYSKNLTRLVQPIDSMSRRKSKVLWTLQEPVNSAKLFSSRSMITNDKIDLYNKAAIGILQHSKADLWSSSRLVAQGHLEESDDGLHLGPLVLKHDTQILLNMYCNDHMNFNDGTCCSSAESSTTLQIVTFAALGFCLVTALMMGFRMKYQNWRRSHQYSRVQSDEEQMVEPKDDTYEIMKALAKLAVIMGYFYLCDRTNFFMKENKYFTQVSFWLPVGYVFALGLFFTEDARYTKVLHRDQTDEWKGWMQLVILVYHLTGASGILPIYMHIRVMVSSYLFLSGYGHFCYFWHRGDAGLVRFLQVLFRLNFLTVVLCLIMNRPYQFYYFVPLVSFWFLMLYVVLAVPPHITAASTEHNSLHYFYLVAKLVTLFSVITILYMSEVFFEKVFVTRPWKALFVTTDDDIHEWWFRWKLDRYSMSFGCVFALIFLLAQRLNIIDDNNHSNLFSPGIALSATLASLIGIGGYTTFSFFCRNKQECNEIHSYTVFIPIVSYIVLRNVSGVLRTRYSTFFAWFGRIALELFVCQSHVWLAADTHGALVLLPGYPVLNSLITSFVFVCASHELHGLTKTLTPYAVPNDWKLALRNVGLFLMVLVPIGIRDGMF